MKNGMRYENVSVNIWTDADFNDCENPDALLLYCYFIANPYGHGLTGIGKMPAERTVRFETRLSAERYAAALAVLTEKHKIVMDGEWVWVVGKAKHSVHGPKQAVGAVNLLASYPASLRDAFLAKYSQLLKRHKVTQAELDRVCIGYPVSAGLASDTGADTGAGADSGTDGKETPPPTEPAGKGHVRNPFSDAFEAAFSATFDTPYQRHKADFIQLAAWLKKHPDATPKGFVYVAEQSWGRGQYKPKNSLSIRGLCADWSTLVAQLQDNKPKAAEQAGKVDYSKGF
jgi:hypothetical protein